MKNLKPLLSHANDSGNPVNNRAQANNPERRRNMALVCASAVCPDDWGISVAGGGADSS